MISSRIDKLSLFCGKLSGYAAMFLLVFILLDVVLRFVFSKSFNMLTEMEWHFFGLIFLLGGGYNLLEDKHVRVDFFYVAFSEKTKKIFSVILHLLLLIPWSLISMVTCYHYAANSYYIREASANPGGLPAMYPIKYMVVFCFFILFLQGVSEIIKDIYTIKRGWKH
ncbi:MAG: TRAP transporter small permease subunit [Saprospiraceae bacterium]|nr:TRAP transporter small permease subunit [Saprospiraceae bacterium]